MIKRVTDKDEIYTLLQKDRYLFAYHIGDLDDFFFHDCTWFGWYKNNQLKELILLYSGLSVPALLVFGFDDLPELLSSILGVLPYQFFCHYQRGLEKYFLSKYEMDYHGTHIKMKYTGFPEDFQTTKTYPCIQLTDEQNEKILAFYEKANPNTYFESFMLATGKYYGILENQIIKSIAGVHVYSKGFSISVLGNVATDPSFRGLGYATLCVSTLLHSLQKDTKYIGLNVKADNVAAIRLYEKLGFISHTEYEEAFFTIKT